MVAASVALAVMVAPSFSGVARADQSTGTGKGIVGGALLGGELVIAVEAAFDVQAPLAYAIGGVLGAGAGAAGGYEVEHNADVHYPLYMLAVGMALVIPAAILALNATSYKPPADYQEDKGASGAEPVADVPQPVRTTPGAPAPLSPTPTTPAAPLPPAGTVAPQPGGAIQPAGPRAPVASIAPRRAHAPRLTLRTAHAPASGALPMSMLELQPQGMRLGVPAVEIRPVFSTAEMRQYGMSQREEVRIPVFKAVFLAALIRLPGDEPACRVRRLPGADG